MGKLINEWVTESLLTEDIKKTVVTYVGRFHPFHEGHNAVYQHLVKKFGKDNVYIGTSDKVELPKSPFRFKEKVEIMTTMFGIPKNKIYQVKNPYAPKEILQSFSEETTAFVTVVGKKDAGRRSEEVMESFLQSININSILSENATSTGIGGNAQGVDDGPGAFYGDMKTFKSEMDDVIGKLGWNIVTYLMDEDDMESFTDTEYPNGPGRYPVSFFPSGKDGLDALSVRYGDALQGNKAYKKWADHIKKISLQLGYEFLNFLEPKDLENVLSDEPKKEKETTGDLKEGFLMEGGAYGHMNHPFDTELGLTFGDLKLIIDGALNGKLEFTREKTDGQALAISYRKDRGIIAARNKGHLKDSGLNALDIKGVSDKFANRGGLTDAYNFAMRDLESAISKLSDAQREKIFKNGSKFMNIEVIWPESVNVIPYGQPLLVFHGTMEYDDSGKAIGADTSDAKVLAGMIKQVNADVQDKYTIQGPPVVKLPQNQELSKLKSKFFGQLSKVQKEFKLKDTDGVAEYHQRWWEQYVDKNSPSTLDNKTKMGLVRRWAFYDKGFRLDKKNITDGKTLDWAKKTDKIDQAKISKQNLRKFEDIFLGVGAEVLSFMSSALTVNPDKALRDMQKRLDQTIKDVKKSGDPKKIAKLKMELERLNAVGGRNKIVPNEGLVFTYKGYTMKLTGTFASLNQILGLMYF